MNRRRGTGILLDAFEYMFAGGCLLAMNFVFMFLFGLLRNLPAILRAGREVLREILILTYRLYRPLIARAQPVTHRHLGIDIGRPPMRVIAAAFLSLLIMLGFDLVLRWPVSVFWSVLAVLHGSAVGLIWDGLEQADGLRMGEDLQ
jgi:hypothetical protein